MKKAANYLLAALVFAITMLLINGVSFAISLAAAIGGELIDSSRGFDRAYFYLMGNLNFVSFLMYFIVFVVFGLWYYFMIVEPQGAARFFHTRRKKVQPIGFLWIGLLALGVQHVTSIIFAVIGAALPEAMESYEQMVESSGLSDYSVMWALCTLILPPLVEEIVFRGLMREFLKRAGAPFIIANVIQAVCFGIFHQNLVQGIYAGLLGFLLGYLAERYGTLLAPMAMHFFYNLFGTVLVDLESRFVPEILQAALIFACVPLTAAVLLLIQFRVGEKDNTVNKEIKESEAQ